MTASLYTDEIVEQCKDEVFHLLASAWHIGKMIKWIHENPTKVKLGWEDPGRITEHWRGFIKINKEHAMNTDTSIPGILVELVPDGYLLVDGWHRSFKAHENDADMQYYVLDFEQQKKFRL